MATSDGKKLKEEAEVIAFGFVFYGFVVALHLLILGSFYAVHINALSI